MNQKEKVSYLKALLYIALADDSVGVDELEYFNRIGEMYGLSGDEIDEIKNSVVEKNEPLEVICEGISERQTKLSLIYELLALCYVDNNYSAKERAGMIDICRLLGVEQEKLMSLEKLMEENVALQKKINTVLERGNC